MNNRFRWIDLDQLRLNEIFSILKPKLVDQELEISDIQKIIKTHLQKHLPIRVSKKTSIEVKRGWIYIGGMYYHELDEKCQKCIELILVYHPDDKKILINKNRFKRMCHLFSDTILHEIIHMSQYRKRSYRPIPDYHPTENVTEDQSYLGCTDEIDAYAFNIACEFISRFKDPNIIRKDLLNNRIKTRKNDSYRMYLKTFNHDYQHKIIERLKKKIIYYLPRAKNKKPFKRNRWLTY